MAHEQVKNSAWVRAASDVVGDLADLFQKEMRLARAELSAKLSTKLQAGIWMAVAGFFGLLAALVLVQAAVFALVSTGIAIHWSCLIVAAGLGLVGTLAYLKGRAGAQEELMPRRTIRQMKQDVTATREQLT
jgi:hypothetical protein